MADLAREAIPARAGGAEPLSERRYSGKFNLRVGESLHRELAIHAAEEGMSLNQYLLRKLSAA
ncbi:toxin-antitoxin system HicB family antitoxin [Micromonospora chalcea]|uniref:toxin-antitoxin system HicB family antitoxin n=1 Tax=Micromonospora chalcea TaxID=1874 RepID=UPI00342E2B52